MERPVAPATARLLQVFADAKEEGAKKVAPNTYSDEVVAEVTQQRVPEQACANECGTRGRTLHLCANCLLHWCHPCKGDHDTMLCPALEILLVFVFTGTRSSFRRQGVIMIMMMVVMMMMVCDACISLGWASSLKHVFVCFGHTHT